MSAIAEANETIKFTDEEDKHSQWTIFAFGLRFWIGFGLAQPQKQEQTPTLISRLFKLDFNFR